MKNSSDCQRYFIHLGRAWYASATLRQVPYLDEVNFGLRSLSGQGTVAEMAVRWFPIDRFMAPRLEVFDDGWHALSTFGDLLARMAEVPCVRRRSITADAFCGLLIQCGFADLTPLEPAHTAPGHRRTQGDVPER